jgi:hypothetical protein
MIPNQFPLTLLGTNQLSSTQVAKKGNTTRDGGSHFSGSCLGCQNADRRNLPRKLPNHFYIHTDTTAWCFVFQGPSQMHAALHDFKTYRAYGAVAVVDAKH